MEHKGTPAWPADIFEALKAHDVRQVAYVPGSGPILLSTGCALSLIDLRLYAAARRELGRMALLVGTAGLEGREADPVRIDLYHRLCRD